MLMVMAVEIDTDFYSHTPRGVQPYADRGKKVYILFLLTHPSRGATVGDIGIGVNVTAFLLTHPSRGATIHELCHCYCFENFYSHTPRGVQHAGFNIKYSANPFLLTHPSRGATYLALVLAIKF